MQSVVTSISDHIMRDLWTRYIASSVFVNGEGVRNAYQTPPERIGVGFKHLVILFLSEVHQERGQDQTQEANVPGCDQFLLRAHACTRSVKINIKCHTCCIFKSQQPMNDNALKWHKRAPTMLF